MGVSATIEVETSTPQRTTSEERAIRARRKDFAVRWIWRLLGYVVVLGLWEWASGTVLEENLLPGPSRVFETTFDLIDQGSIVESFRATLTRIGIAITISFFLGAILGILTQNAWLRGFFKDAITIGLTAPGLIWVLITAIVFGNRWYGPLIAIVLTTFALVSVNVAEGIGSLPKDTLDMARAFGVSLFNRNRHIVIPHLAPFLFTGLRFCFSIGWKVTVLTEIFSSSSGIGFEMRIAQTLFRQDELITWILLFFLFALFLEKVVLQFFENRFFRWRKDIATA